MPAEKPRSPNKIAKFITNKTIAIRPKSAASRSLASMEILIIVLKAINIAEILVHLTPNSDVFFKSKESAFCSIN